MMKILKLSFFKKMMLMLLMFFILMMYYSIILFYNKKIIIIEWEILMCQSLQIVMPLIIDWLSCMFLSVVMLISSAVMFFSDFYMKEENFKKRFCLIVILFVISMMFLIISPNMITILLGWDGLGLVSYVLVVYYQNNKSASAGMLTLLTNRVGDIAFLLSIAWMLNHGNWNFLTLNYYYNYSMMYWICLFMLLAAMTKSAQLPFSAWLPAAMSAPTPVSALVHSSTLVTAGIFLMIRLSYYFTNMPMFQMILLFASSLTMLMASMVANNDYDIKKIIALSTLSQLGLMMAIISLNYVNLAFFHLIVHAMFKAMLFICAGIMIYKFMHFQDIRMMGYLTMHMPIISICLNTSNLALCGIPFMAGFYSKDLILEQFLFCKMNFMCMIMLFVATGMTVMYSLRMSYFSFWGTNSIKSINLVPLNFKMNKGALILTFGSIMSGSILSWLTMNPTLNVFMPLKLKMMIIMLIMIGILLGNLLYKLNFLKNKMYIYYKFKFYNSQMWFFPENSSQSFLMNTMMLSKKSFILDNNWVESMSAQGSYKFIMSFSKFNEICQENSMKLFMMVTMIPMTMIMFLMFFT
uniref:NADH-ubiquinone oxidoreductase chain 5 n=1 Tax=Metaperipatus inae TaxID=444703 RepID=B3F5L0_9BILA|nr:NADH dehydrogenase subunit 5 [Metaperipatus inae]ABQ95568.1 NADH dehydrogenase subunit 5 [Metaperipatus inae]